MTTRHFVIAREEGGQTAAAVLRGHLRLSWSATRRLFEERRVRLSGVPCLDPARRVQAGQRLDLHDAPSPVGASRKPRSGKPPPKPRFKEGEPNVPRLTIRYADEHLVVVEKPPGLTTMRHADEAAEFGDRGRRFLPTTLAHLLPALLAAHEAGRRSRVRPVHRIDKETSGLVVFARTPKAERHLGQQFRAHTIERRYLAVVRGQAVPGRIESYLVRDRGDGRRGSTALPGAGQRAVTHVRVVERLGDYTLVECRLETGRTHQVRIHLGEAGTPLCGERVYDRPINGQPLPDQSQATRIALHAATLGLEHPATGKRLLWTSPLPDDLADLVQRLRRS